ncbi:hypothetical protein EV356DRAFT_531988 [Viridothelium virens]|uniref:Uncharacterized protein n=1 Tax=Viridothelium virens TaxID=1048519 RepID=A0A6A6HCQ0_VIRVR|nr:hypothetical protein EV356DRAFT_531988 [Viridothelium virens]
MPSGLPGAAQFLCVSGFSALIHREQLLELLVVLPVFLPLVGVKSELNMGDVIRGDFRGDPLLCSVGSGHFVARDASQHVQSINNWENLLADLNIYLTLFVDFANNVPAVARRVQVGGILGPFQAIRFVIMLHFQPNQPIFVGDSQPQLKESRLVRQPGSVGRRGAEKD